MNLNLQQLVGLTALSILLLGGLVVPGVQWLIYRFCIGEEKKHEKKSIPQDLHPNIEKMGDDWMKHDGVYRRELILSQLPERADVGWFRRISAALPPDSHSSMTTGWGESVEEDYPDEISICNITGFPKTSQSGNETVLVSIYFSILAPTKDDLDRRTEWVEKMISSEGGSVKLIRGRYIEAIANSGPLTVRQNHNPLEIPIDAAVYLSLPVSAPTYRDYTRMYNYTPDPTYLS
jgi:hypothetical protein